MMGIPENGVNEKNYVIAKKDIQLPL